jgi:hypothetical protein
MAQFALTEAFPPEPPGITSRFFLPDPDLTDRMRILVVSFAGEYPDGSRGNAHGAFIAVSAMHGLLAFNAHCVVLDFRDLTYRWGNTLLGVFDDISQFKDAGAEPDSPPFPIVVVTSEKSRDGILSLVTPLGQPAPEWHFEDLDAAIEYGVRKAGEWLDA